MPRELLGAGGPLTDYCEQRIWAGVPFLAILLLNWLIKSEKLYKSSKRSFTLISETLAMIYIYKLYIKNSNYKEGAHKPSLQNTPKRGEWIANWGPEEG